MSTITDKTPIKIPLAAALTAAGLLLASGGFIYVHRDRLEQNFSMDARREGDAKERFTSLETRMTAYEASQQKLNDAIIRMDERVRTSNEKLSEIRDLIRDKK